MADSDLPLDGGQRVAAVAPRGRVGERRTRVAVDGRVSLIERHVLRRRSASARTLVDGEAEPGPELVDLVGQELVALGRPAPAARPASRPRAPGGPPAGARCRPVRRRRAPRRCPPAAAGPASIQAASGAAPEPDHDLVDRRPRGARWPGRSGRRRGPRCRGSSPWKRSSPVAAPVARRLDHARRRWPRPANPRWAGPASAIGSTYSRPLGVGAGGVRPALKMAPAGPMGMASGCVPDAADRARATPCRETPTSGRSCWPSSPCPPWSSWPWPASARSSASTMPTEAKQTEDRRPPRRVHHRPGPPAPDRAPPDHAPGGRATTRSPAPWTSRATATDQAGEAFASPRAAVGRRQRGPPLRGRRRPRSSRSRTCGRRSTTAPPTTPSVVLDTYTTADRHPARAGGHPRLPQRPARADRDPDRQPHPGQGQGGPGPA